MNKINLSYDTLWNISCKGDFEQLKSSIYEEKNKDKQGVIVSNSGGWQSKDVSNNNNFQNIKKFIESCTEEIRRDLEIVNHLEFKIDHMWINVNNKSNFNHIHDHVAQNIPVPKTRIIKSSILSGVFYVECPENSGNICFYNNSKRKTLVDMNLLKNPRNNYFHDVNNITPKKGELYIWFSDLPHSVVPNETDNDRISIAFNVSLFPVQN